ncbi:MAG: DUF4338 domain-containing protein [Gammaproteobacteria bacterium]|nr:DUF4338 domain-containing protein [Gammaproteobacteria bacterium]
MPVRTDPSPGHAQRTGALSSADGPAPLPGRSAEIGETLWYVATWREQWVALLSVSAAALKCGVRDRWIGWDFRLQYDRLKLVAER